MNRHLAALGPIVQLAYVPNDLDAALRHWTRNVGAGPFFTLNHVAYREARYRGQRVDIDFSMAVGYWGDMQIELVQQHNDAPSIYREFLERTGEGLQHVGALVPDLDAALDANGWRSRIVQDGTTAIGQRFAYVDTVRHDGTMLELIETTPKILAAFEHMKRAAREWDGTDPIRVR